MDMTFRDANRGDVPALHVIEIQGYENPWSETDIAKLGDAITVAEIGGRAEGFYNLVTQRNRIRMMRFTISTSKRRHGFGSKLMKFMLAEVNAFDKITTVVQESNLAACCFLREHGWKCVNTLPDHFEVCGVKENGLYFLRKL